MQAVLLPVGPGDRDVARMTDVLRMLERHENPERVHVVVIDDSPSPRDLDPGWPVQTVLRTTLRRRRTPDPYSAMTAATITGLRFCRSLPVDLAVKLDTDAAVAAPFTEAIRRAFADRRLGVVGSYDVMIGGARRDWSVWEPALSRAARRFSATRQPGGRRMLWFRTRTEVETVAELRRRADARVPIGAHCLGGAYAVSRSFLDRADLRWRPWVGTGLSEDVVIGVLCAAAGLEMRSMTAPGEPFAVAWQGLPGTPQTILESGHSIVHSVKADTLEQERALRAELDRSRS